MKTLTKILNYNFITVLFLAAFSLNLVSSFAIFSQSLTTLYGDARSRLLISRGVIDSLTPGFVQLGGVWPPIIQLLYLPTIWIDYLLYSGISGMLVSLFGAALILIFMSKLIFLLTKNKLVTILAVSSIILNPSFLYMSSIPMSEILFIAFVVTSTYFLSKWLTTEKLEYLPLAAFSTSLASLTRYEAYFFPLFAAFIILIGAFYKCISLSQIKGFIILYLTPALTGIFFWFIYNLVIYGNPFHFVAGETSIYSRAAGEFSGQLTRGDLLNSGLILLDAFVVNLGLISVLLTLFAITAAIFLSKYKYIAPIFLLFSPIAFDLTALFLGSTDIFTMRFSGYLYNTRIGLFALPIIALGYAFLAKWKPLFIPVLLILCTQLFVLFSEPPITLTEAINSSYSERGLSQKELTDWLRQNPSSGKTMLSFTANQTVVFDAKTPLNTVISEGTGQYWVRGLDNPERVAQRVILSPIQADIIWQLAGLNQNYFKNYQLSYENKNFKVYDLISENELTSYNK